MSANDPVGNSIQRSPSSGKRSVTLQKIKLRTAWNMYHLHYNELEMVSTNSAAQMSEINHVVENKAPFSAETHKCMSQDASICKVWPLSNLCTNTEHLGTIIDYFFFKWGNGISCKAPFFQWRWGQKFLSNTRRIIPHSPMLLVTHKTALTAGLAQQWKKLGRRTRSTKAPSSTPLWLGTHMVAFHSLLQPVLNTESSCVGS